MTRCFLWPYLPILLGADSEAILHDPTLCTEEGQQIYLLILCEVNWSNLGVEIRIGITTMTVELDHLLEAVEATVMHVGSRPIDLAQRWSLEGASMLEFASYFKTSFIEQVIIAPSYSRVMEPLIRQTGT